jgi:hypothetical protein
VFTTNGETTSDDIWVLSLEDRQARPWLATPAVEWGGRLSLDGKWIAYTSDESGREEVYVQPFPGPGAKHLVSDGGGRSPIWSKDGMELFYRKDDEVFAVKIEARSGFSAGGSSLLFSGRYRLTGRDYDVSADGKRFVMMRANDARTTERLSIVLNWWRLLDSRLRGSGATVQ